MAEHIFLISDIHIGNPGFINEKPLLEFLDYVKKESGALVINGDFLDFQQGPQEKILLDFDEVLSKLIDLVRNDIKVWYVVGNHDIGLRNFSVISDFVNIVYPSIRLELGGRIVHIEHGHLFDKYYEKIPRLYNLGSRLLGLMLRKWPNLGDDLGSLYKFIESRIHGLSITPASDRYSGDLSEYRSGAESIIKGTLKVKAAHAPIRPKTMDPVDLVSFGHTHKPEAVPLGGGLYINSGSWMKMATYVEFYRHRVYLCDWLSGKRELVAEALTSAPKSELRVEG